MSYDELDQTVPETDMTTAPDPIESVHNTKPAEGAMELWQTRHGLIPAIGAEDTVARSLRTYREWAVEELDTIGAVVDEGGVVLEYGAEYGAHTLWLSQLVGRSGQVHVVEPRRLGLIALCTTVGINRLVNVYPVHGVLGKGDASVELPASGAQPVEWSRSLRLDDMGLEALQLIKLNTPGGLLDVVTGGRETLRRHRPAVYFRLSSMDGAAVEITALKDLGYRCWSHLPYLHNPGNTAGVKANIFPGWVHQNVIAVHRSTAAEFEHLPEL